MNLKTMLKLKLILLLRLRLEKLRSRITLLDLVSARQMDAFADIAASLMEYNPQLPDE